MNTFKLGKLPARHDDRTIRLRSIFMDRVLPTVPDSFDVDQALALSIPLPMFGNDKWGDCVMASRAHMTLRFEGFEQSKILAIKDSEVLNEYWKEQQRCSLLRLLIRHPDNGLNELDSLKAWRKGWKAAGKTYDIYAFAGIDWKIPQEIMASISFLRGAYTGVALPVSAQAQTGPGLVWDVDTTADGEPGSWGLHSIYLKAYNKVGPTAITWGALQQMTWAFVDRYFDEAYGVVDDRDRFLKNSPVDVNALGAILREIAA
jgi:hypothetical protein